MTIRTAALLGLFTGLVLGLFIALSSLMRFDLSYWQATNSGLVMASLALTGFTAYQSRSIRAAIVNVAIYYLVIMAFYVGSYVLMTTVFIDRLAWIPFWERDYTYHGFASVRSYMEHASNFRDLLVLQIISCLISSVFYAVAGVAGFTVRTIGRHPARA